MSARSILQAQLRSLQASRAMSDAASARRAESDERSNRMMYELLLISDPQSVPATFEEYHRQQCAKWAALARMPAEWQAHYRHLTTMFVDRLLCGGDVADLEQEIAVMSIELAAKGAAA